MALLDARASGSPQCSMRLSDAQTGTGASTNVADRGPAHKGGIVRISTVAGATPTCTYALEVSADNSTFVACTYADTSTPNTDVATTFALTSTTTVTKIIKVPSSWRYFRITYSANTNMTNTVDFLFSDGKRLLVAN